MDKEKAGVRRDLLHEAENRDKIIVKTSVIGIVTNIFLATFKAIIGFLSNSIAVILDAVNNLSDVLSSDIRWGMEELNI